MSASAAATSQLEQELIAADFAGLDGCALIEKVLADSRLGQVALVSSFGTESAVLLALVAEVAPATPVVFLDTLRHFGETLRYRDRLVAQLGLEDVRSVRPDPAEIARRDPDLLLFQRDPDACCALRKVEPLERALSGFGGWITGRKRFQALTRADLPAVEWAPDEGRFKINPLAGWSPDRVAAEFEARDLPRHPLEADGFLSIGCMPCTERVAQGADPRSGRWSGQDKTECGIHRTADPSPVTFL
ncbi:phosphoadenylyl-sulfate reductase [Inquilinus sp. YAF38]|uniref:phosphoadenylyl-sulfate reductase n=1 Tax=Inquilinus sp. YAF38 TaxID=3233084 RepID=UPI003F93BD55